MKYGFSYFCGANAILRLNDYPLLEASAISYSITESKFPLYGYSSRFYDAVARGRVLVTGNLAINFVHQDYLFRAMEAASGKAPPTSEPTGQTPKLLADMYSDYITGGWGDNATLQELASNLAIAHWNNLDTNSPRTTTAKNPHDNFTGFKEIQVTFGPQQLSRGSTGETGVLIQDVHFTGRSNVVQISEDVIVEVYPFIARNVASLRSK